ncbi:MAG: M1 family aminopeptidase, partial [Bacteroidales bacterium]
RKATLTNLNYKLRFSIPYALTQSVKGFAIIEFNSSDTTQDLILDFAQDSTHLHYLAINQHVCMPKIENGHIRLPKEQIRLKNNQVFVHFTSANRPLNRRSDLLYTLLVPNKAAQVFPCFDQADLKAHYTLELEIPKDWEAVANSPCLEHCSSSCFDSLAFYAQNLEFVNFTNNLVEDSLQTHDRENLQTQNIAESYKRICFSPTELLPTYLFSFVVGKLQKETFFEDGRKIHIYHRETDTTKIAQCKDIAKQVYQSLQWLEDYTQIAYPFTKYDLIILAGFQYGGMEHTGATLYNAKYLFLPSNANIKDQIKRAKLIAHETAHLWFGNYVTMEWFNDVWMKEVFANFFASKMLPSLCGEVDQELNRILDLYPSAYLEDRTSGTNAIQQKLDNMQDAALIYGNIIYDKSPIVFDMLYKKMGELSFKSAIRDYLQTFSYGNASWDQLIHIFSRYTSSSLINWSEAWVKQKGMPYIQIDYKNNKVTITQTNLYKTHQLWEQNLCLRVKGEGQEEVRRILLNTHKKIEEFPFKIDSIFPNIDAQTYGYIQLDSRTAKNLL